MPDSLSPVTMTEDYYAKIAGQDVTPPDPATREQKWLDAIAGRVDGLAEDVEDLGDIVPTPEAADSGKVLTAGADGTASWQTASGGGEIPTITPASTPVSGTVVPFTSGGVTYSTESDCRTFILAHPLAAEATDTPGEYVLTTGYALVSGDIAAYMLKDGDDIYYFGWDTQS